MCNFLDSDKKPIKKECEFLDSEKEGKIKEYIKKILDKVKRGGDKANHAFYLYLGQHLEAIEEIQNHIQRAPLYPRCRTCRDKILYQLLNKMEIGWRAIPINKKIKLPMPALKLFTQKT